MSGESIGALLDGVQLRWDSEGTESHVGLQRSALAEVERLRRVTLPDDFKALYQRANGMPEGQGDSELFRFLPIEEVVTVGETFRRPEASDPAASRLVFVDYCLGAHYFAADVAPGEKYGSVWLVHSISSAHQVADSVQDFLHAYVQDPARLLT